MIESQENDGESVIIKTVVEDGKVITYEPRDFFSSVNPTDNTLEPNPVVYVLTAHSTEYSWTSMTAVLNMNVVEHEEFAKAHRYASQGDYRLSTDPYVRDSTANFKIPGDKRVTVQRNGDEDSATTVFYLIPSKDSKFEKDETDRVTISSAMCNGKPLPTESIDDTLSRPVVILQAPEFISGEDTVGTKVVNDDSYEIYINHTSNNITRINAVVPEGRSCNYCFVDGNNLSLQSSNEAPLFHIVTTEDGVGILTLRSLTAEEVENPPTFTICAYDPGHPKLYDLATVRLGEFFYARVYDPNCTPNRATRASESLTIS